MINIPLSNNTTLVVSICLADKSITIRQTSQQTKIDSIAPDPVVKIPMIDLKSLVKSIKTIVGFLS